MRRLLTHDVGPMPIGGIADCYGPVFVNAGATVAFAVRDRVGPRWVPMALGVAGRDVGDVARVTVARQEALDTVERWCLMAPRRCALPVRGYRWSADAEWTSTGPLWAPCMFKDDRRFGIGAVLIADAAADHRAPVLMEAADVGLWLTLPLWEARGLLDSRRAAA